MYSRLWPRCVSDYIYLSVRRARLDPSRSKAPHNTLTLFHSDLNMPPRHLPSQVSRLRPNHVGIWEYGPWSLFLPFSHPVRWYRARGRDGINKPVIPHSFTFTQVVEMDLLPPAAGPALVDVMWFFFFARCPDMGTNSFNNQYTSFFLSLSFPPSIPRDGP